GQGGKLTLGKEARDRAQALRGAAQKQWIENDYVRANASANEAAAYAQTDELLSVPTTAGALLVSGEPSLEREGPSVTYHLKTKYTVPSRNDEQLIEIARLDM